MIYTPPQSIFPIKILSIKLIREYEFHLKKINEIQNNDKSPYHILPITDPFALSNYEAHKFSRESQKRGFF